MDTCSVCGKELSPFHHWDIFCSPTQNTYILCSPSCLVDKAWQIKEGQTKLSKSKEAKDDGS